MRDWIHIDPSDDWTGGIGSLATPETGIGFRNQTDSDGNYIYSLMYNMRGKLMWGGVGTAYGNGKLPTNATCDWTLLPVAP